MQITKQADYAIRTILVLAQSRGELLSTKDIATAQAIPGPFLNKIMQSLAKARLVETVRGVQGGVRLARAPEEITLREIIEAVDGPITVNRCLMGEGICQRQSFCPVHEVLATGKEAFLAVLEGATVAKLLAKEQINRKGGV